jgi:hypothetical protein
VHSNSSLTSSSSSRRLAVPVDARLAKPTTVKGTTTVTSKKRQLAKQLAKQEQQQKKTLAVSKTTRGLSTRSSEQAGTGPSSQRRGSRFYFNFTGFPFPLGPFFERKTVRTEVRADGRLTLRIPAWLTLRGSSIVTSDVTNARSLTHKHPSVSASGTSG